jgi:hypothetical protein
VSPRPSPRTRSGANVRRDDTGKLSRLRSAGALPDLSRMSSASTATTGPSPPPYGFRPSRGAGSAVRGPRQLWLVAYPQPGRRDASVSSAFQCGRSTGAHEPARAAGVRLRLRRRLGRAGCTPGAWGRDRACSPRCLEATDGSLEEEAGRDGDELRGLRLALASGKDRRSFRRDRACHRGRLSLVHRAAPASHLRGLHGGGDRSSAVSTPQGACR